MSAKKATKAEKAAGWLQIPLMAPELKWEATPVSQLPAWTDAKRICIDVECRDDHLFELGPGVRRGGYVCGIAFAIEDGPAHYLPVRHESGGNLNPEHVWSYLRDQAARFTGEAVFNMAPYDLDYLWENGVHLPKVKAILDVQNAEPILDEFQKTYGLDAVCARRGLPGKDETELRKHAQEWGVDPKTGLWRLHAGAVGRYAEQDVYAPLALLRAQEKEIEEQGLRETFDLESKVTCPLVRMTRRGLRIDLDELDRVEAWAKERLSSYIDRIHYLTGVRIGSISNANEVARALKAHGIDVEMRVRKGTGPGTDKPEKREPSIAKLWLQQQDDEVAKAVISGREFAKLLGTYVAGFRKHLVGDRLHPSFKQMRGAADDDETEDDEGGARFGRCSAKHPNVQAQMKRSKEILKRWRKVIVADEGKELISGDFCYSADTEILTRRGWIRFDALDPSLGEDVAQWQDGTIRFVKPSAYHRSHFVGNLVQVEGRAVKFAVTPNHDLVFVDTTGATRKVKAEAFGKVSNKWRFVSAGRLCGGAAEDHDLLRLVVAIQADATNRGGAWRFWLSREDKVARVPYLLDRLKIAFTSGFSEAKGNQTFFQFEHDVRIDRYLTREDKTFKLDAFLALDEESREAFLDELPFWDGQRAVGNYCSTNLVNCEVVQILAVLTGRRSNVHEYQWKEDRKVLGVTQLSSRWYSGVQKLKAEDLVYDGEVFCVTVPSGAIVTRRNGSPIVLGNSQQEPRWTIHYSEICGLPGSHAAGNTLRTDPLYDCYQMLVELVKSEKDTDLGKLRDDLKEVYLGRCYGMGGGKLSKKLKLPTEMKMGKHGAYEGAGPEAQAIINRFDEGVPYVRKLAKLCTKAAQSKGYILGVDGRRIRFELMPDGKLKDEHKGLNKLIQYAAAWQTKKALVQLDAEGFPLQLTVHDEFDYSEDDPERARHMAEVMCDVHRLGVPSRVDVKKGRSYGELDKFCTVTSKGFDLKETA